MMSSQRRARGDRLDALRAWLRLEYEYEIGRAPDADLNSGQDHLADLLGPNALFAADDYLRERGLFGQDLMRLGDDDGQLEQLLRFLEDARRPGFETRREQTPRAGDVLWWTAGRPERWRDPILTARGPHEQPDQRPIGLLVMAEYGVSEPVWDRPYGEGHPVDLTELGVSDVLVQGLRDWNSTFESLALSDFKWSSTQAESTWIQEGLRLAHLLQEELPEVEVRYFHEDDDRPLREIPSDTRRRE